MSAPPDMPTVRARWYELFILDRTYTEAEKAEYAYLVSRIEADEQARLNASIFPATTDNPDTDPQS